MKKLAIIFITLLTSFCCGARVEAASFNATASARTVKPNATFTVSVGGNATGRVDLRVSNGTLLSDSSIWVENGFQTVTVKAGTSGTVTVTATPAKGFSDADGNIYNPGSRSVNVTITTESNQNTTSPPTNKPATNRPATSSKPSSSNSNQQSSDNTLASLTVSSGELKPAFNKNTTDYTVDLKDDTTKIKISAQASDAKASVAGTGEVTLKYGTNQFAVTVTAEDGTEKVYHLTITLDATPKVFLDYQGQTIGVVRDLEKVKLAGFEAKNYEHDGVNFTIFQNGSLVAIYGINPDQKTSFYLYDAANHALMHRLIPIEIADHTYYVIDPNDATETVKINDQEVPAIKLNLPNYYLLTTVDMEGHEVQYIYETDQGTLGLFSPELYGQVACKNHDGIFWTIIILESLALLVLLGFGVYYYKTRITDPKAQKAKTKAKAKTQPSQKAKNQHAKS